MKVKHFLLPFTLSIFMLSVSGCSTVNKKQPESMPEVTLVTADKRGSRFNSTQVAAVMPQSGPTNPLELEGFLDAYFADQMESLDFMGTGSNLELSRVLGYGLITILLFSLAVIGRNRQLKR